MPSAMIERDVQPRTGRVSVSGNDGDSSGESPSDGCNRLSSTSSEEGSSDGCNRLSSTSSEEGSSDGCYRLSSTSSEEGPSDGCNSLSNTSSEEGSSYGGNSGPSSINSEDVKLDPDGCSHYRRKARPVAPCCSRVYSCRFCHDEKEDHEMKRHEVQEMVCTQCDTRQPMQQDCAHCGSRLGKYYCDVCRLHDDEEKGQYHCTECGICRSGGRDKFFHCAECDLCLPNIMQNNHKCLKGVGRSDCGVCLEDIHSARSGGQVLPCGHLLHVHCYKEMVQHRLNTCPKCKVSIKNRKLEWARMDKAIRHSIVPAEYRHTYINVLCCDCHSTGPTKYHIIGLKCRECGSYNTSPAGPLERRDSKGLTWYIAHGMRRITELVRG